MSRFQVECLEGRDVPAIIFNNSVPIDLVVFIPQTGHFVEVQGSLHETLSVTVDSAGGLHFKEHFQPQGVSGVDLTDGTKYQATGVTQDQETFAPGGTTEVSFVNNFRLIGQGPENNYTVHETQHFTINPNGVVTANVDQLVIDNNNG